MRKHPRIGGPGVHSLIVGITEQARPELRALVAEQRRFLTVSCAAFDAGDHAEAKRIATCLRALLLDSGTGPSLLGELSSRDQIGWLDTAGSLLPSVAGQGRTPLVHVSAERRPGPFETAWLPTLDAWDRRLQERPRLPAAVEESLARMRAEGVLRSRGQWLPFADWWSAEVMYDNHDDTFTRADLVRALTEPGGVALDAPAQETADEWPSFPDASAAGVDPDPERRGPPLGPTLSSVRQVAFEVEMSLYRADPPT
jgi:hypothetical protein